MWCGGRGRVWLASLLVVIAVLSGAAPATPMRSAASSAAPLSAADSTAVAGTIERAAKRLSVRLKHVRHARRVLRAATHVERAVARGRTLVAARTGPAKLAAAAELSRISGGVARARAAVKILRSGDIRRARRRARLARRRLDGRLVALRALDTAPAAGSPGLVAPIADTPPATGPAPAPTPPSCTRSPLPAFRTSGYAVRAIRLEDEPHRLTEPVDFGQPVNEDGSLHFERNGVETPHPTALEGHSLSMAESYRLTGDPEYLRRAIGDADRLLANAVPYGDGIYLSYLFAFDVFGDPADRLDPPWFSGMAQGRALLMFRRLFEATGEQRWLRAEDKIYETTFDPPCAGKTWTTFVDDDGYLWFEEYPGARIPTRVLNGHTSATFGYWGRARATGDLEVARLFDGAATTALHYAAVLRRPGEYSAYSVHTPLQDPIYHELHIDQLHRMAKLTGDPAFEELAQAYTQDSASAPGG